MAETIECSLVYDQLNGASLCCLELVSRRFQIIIGAHAENAHHPQAPHLGQACGRLGPLARIGAPQLIRATGTTVLGLGEDGGQTTRDRRDEMDPAGGQETPGPLGLPGVEEV